MRDALILVIGTGPAGLAAAVALAERGATVQAVGPRPLASAARDTRTAALFGPSVTFMRSIGAFDRLEGASEPITGIRLIDDTGRLLRAPDALFKARDVGRQAFGLNCPNAAIVEALVSRAGTLPTLSLINDSVSAIEPRAEHVAVILASGRTLEARLVVGADGRGSPSRIAAGISATTWSHPQTAIVTSFAHSRPHGGISTEFHRASGPFTTVPLKGDRSSLVWVEQPEEARRLAALDEAAMIRAIEERLMGLLGTVSELAPRAIYPLSSAIADRLAARRIALVGEAAHVFPPIGAQGLNLGLRDVAHLAEIVGAAYARGDDPGSDAMLQRYEAERRTDVASRTYAVDILNRTLVAGALPLDLLRGAGIAALSAIAPIRDALVNAGLGWQSGLPASMRE